MFSSASIIKSNQSISKLSNQPINQLVLSYSPTGSDKHIAPLKIISLKFQTKF